MKSFARAAVVAAVVAGAMLLGAVVESAEQTAGVGAGSPGVAGSTSPGPAPNSVVQGPPAPLPALPDADAIIAAGQQMALEGASSGNYRMVRAGRMLIRDGARLKRAEVMAQ